MLFSRPCAYSANLPFEAWCGQVLEHYEAQSDAPQYIVTGLRERIADRRETAPPDAKKPKGSLKRNMSKSGVGDAGAV